jgi:hypothetical protein
MKTESAMAAKAIKSELKTAFPDIRFSVTSQIYSGGDSVNIAWNDGPEREAVRKISNKYQMGEFNGMTDSYEFSNRNKEIPQVKFVFVTRHK